MTATIRRMTTEREQELAHRMFKAIVPLTRGYSDEESTTALVAMVCEVIKHAGDPVEAAESVCEAIQINFRPGGHVGRQ